MKYKYRMINDSKYPTLYQAQRKSVWFGWLCGWEFIDSFTKPEECRAYIKNVINGTNKRIIEVLEEFNP